MHIIISQWLIEFQMNLLTCTCWSRLWHTQHFMERDSPILSHPQILSLVYSGLLPTFTCFSLRDHTECPVSQENVVHLLPTGIHVPCPYCLQFPKCTHFHFLDVLENAHLKFVKNHFQRPPVSQKAFEFTVIALKHICQMNPLLQLHCEQFSLLLRRIPQFRLANSIESFNQLLLF